MIKQLQLNRVIAIFLFLVFFIHQPVFSQDTLKLTRTRLLLTHKEKDKTKTIKTGKTITYWLKDSKKSHKGKITAIKESSMIVDGQEIAFEDLSKIRITFTGTKIAGGILSGGGIVISGIGAVLFATLVSEGGLAGPLIAVAVGGSVVGIGLVAILVGAPMIFIGKKFDLEEKWDISATNVPQ